MQQLSSAGIVPGLAPFPIRNIATTVSSTVQSTPQQQQMFPVGGQQQNILGGTAPTVSTPLSAPLSLSHYALSQSQSIPISIQSSSSVATPLSQSQTQLQQISQHSLTLAYLQQQQQQIQQQQLQQQQSTLGLSTAGAKSNYGTYDQSQNSLSTSMSGSSTALGLGIGVMQATNAGRTSSFDPNLQSSYGSNIRHSSLNEFQQQMGGLGSISTSAPLSSSSARARAPSMQSAVLPVASTSQLRPFNLGGGVSLQQQQQQIQQQAHIHQQLQQQQLQLHLQQQQQLQLQQQYQAQQQQLQRMPFVSSLPSNLDSRPGKDSLLASSSVSDATYAYSFNPSGDWSATSELDYLNSSSTKENTSGETRKNGRNDNSIGGGESGRSEASSEFIELDVSEGLELSAVAKPFVPRFTTSLPGATTASGTNVKDIALPTIGLSQDDSHYALGSNVSTSAWSLDQPTTMGIQAVDTWSMVHNRGRSSSLPSDLLNKYQLDSHANVNSSSQDIDGDLDVPLGGFGIDALGDADVTGEETELGLGNTQDTFLSNLSHVNSSHPLHYVPALGGLSSGSLFSGFTTQSVSSLLGQGDISGSNRIFGVNDIHLSDENSTSGFTQGFGNSGGLRHDVDNSRQSEFEMYSSYLSNASSLDISNNSESATYQQSSSGYSDRNLDR